MAHHLVAAVPDCLAFALLWHASPNQPNVQTYIQGKSGCLPSNILLRLSLAPSRGSHSVSNDPYALHACAGGGKSECYKTLRDALNLLHQINPEDTAQQAVTSSCLNPKSISLGELYGAYNPVSNDWKDGVASTLVRQAMADDSNSMKWLVFDGPVDAVWVENLNTVSSHACCCVFHIVCSVQRPAARVRNRNQ